jgi:Na+-translocating ferredoxin:NAD+ oxidoreductase subunit B
VQSISGSRPITIEEDTIMSDEMYQRLAKVLDTFPNGFPSTENGVEMKILKRIFQPDEAELFCHLKLYLEPSEQIAERTGRPLEAIREMLTTMWQKGQIFGVHLGETSLYKMVPWVLGIYEYQLPHLDRELAEMCEEFNKVFGEQFFSNNPQLMQVIPIEREIDAQHEALPYEKVSSIIENGQAFRLSDCICKKEQGLMEKSCTRPIEVCLAIAPIPDAFDKARYGQIISKEEAYNLLNKSEENGLVHLTWNVKNGHFFICNCCGCCCGVLRSINELGVPASKVVNSYYFAEIDPEICASCGTCLDERCQVKAIEEGEEAYRVIKDKCIGCGLCVTTCPSEAIHLVRKDPEAIVAPPEDEMSWFETRAKMRGVDISAYK